MNRLAILILTILISLSTYADDGSLLWMKWEMQTKSKQSNIIIEEAEAEQQFNEPGKANEIYASLLIAKFELSIYFKGEETIHLDVDETAPKDGGFTISHQGKDIVIRSASQAGVLYGAYHLLCLQELGKMPADGQTIKEIPATGLRILNHWDNPNGTIERGFAGRSIFWHGNDNGEKLDIARIINYGRANASIGINGTVLNNVNADAKALSAEYIRQTATIAKYLRAYGMKVYLSINFASPKTLGGLKTSDPLNPDVRQWWKDKAKEIYEAIPDFGGFLVKANSEGQSGPQDYGRTHADGANMLAEALKPFEGIVMWRAFVYAPDSPDRACQAYDEFMPFDGKFADNVILQVKNGAVDFQPREPVHPLFYSLKKTKIMPEFQITQEYLGESVHSVFLAPMWKELLDDEPQMSQKGFEAIAGVSNIGDSKNWCGSDMAQANWYAFGRLAWNPALSSEQIADEWLKLTFTKDEKFVEPVKEVMLSSHEACVSYMMPMGIHHIFAGGHHYGPEPWYAPRGLRADWTPPYYHKAAADGMGFDRTHKGSNNVAQYPKDMEKLFDNIDTCPEKYLLWFHHVAWNHKLPCGETLWNRLCHKYDEGVREAERFAKVWDSVEGLIDAERYAELKKRYDRQAKDAWWWRDACLLYFQTFSNQPFPADCPPVRHNLDDLKRYHLNMDNYTAANMDLLP